MKAAVLLGPENLTIREQPLPVPGEEELLVKIHYCGICTLEQRLYTGAMKIQYPIVPGHEASGTILEVGKRVNSDHKPGARVALDLVTRCRSCYYCRSGSSNLCENRYKKDQRVLGGFAEYIVVKPSQVFTVDPDLPLIQAAFTEPVACCIRSLKKIGLHLAEDILIVGAGPMGLLHSQVARSMGARVFISDIIPERLEAARALGADEVVDARDAKEFQSQVREKTNRRGVSACVITSPAWKALASSFSVLADNARVNIYTSYGDKPSLPIDLNSLHHHEYLITGTEGRTEEDFLQASRLLSFGKVNVEPLISQIVSFQDLKQGMASAISQETYRVLLDTER